LESERTNGAILIPDGGQPRSRSKKISLLDKSEKLSQGARSVEGIKKEGTGNILWNEHLG